MMSGHATIDTAVRAVRVGALNFLEKPLNTDALLIAVDTALRLTRAEAEARDLRRAAGRAGELVGESHAIKRLVEQIGRAAKSAASVLVTGERGTGKELVARAIHTLSPRAKGPLEKLNCAALAERADRVRALRPRGGRVHRRDQAAARQVRARERAARSFSTRSATCRCRCKPSSCASCRSARSSASAGNETIKVDVRVVAATNRDLVAACESGAFRADLYDRLNVLPLTIPPLRARREDIAAARAPFPRPRRDGERPARHACSTTTPSPRSPATRWPGNVRELRNLIERLVILTPDDRTSAATTCATACPARPPRRPPGSTAPASRCGSSSRRPSE